MSRWSIPLGLLTAWLVFGLIGAATRGSVWFLLSAVALLAGVFGLLVAIIGALRSRSAQRAEELELLREIAAQGRTDED